MPWLKFIFSHSLFISLCATALCFQSYRLLHISPDEMIYAFIFFSTLSSYNFYWLLGKYRFNKPIGILSFLSNNISNLLLFSLAAMGMLVCLYFLPHIFKHAVFAIGLTLIYSLPMWPIKYSIGIKNLGILKTALLAFTWTYVTVIIPASNFADNNAVVTLMITRFFFLFMICIIFDQRDIKTDKLHGLQSLATNFNATTVHYIMIIAFIFFIAGGFWAHYQFPDPSQLIANILTGIALWYIYRLTLKKQGYLFYYFVVDGLMLFSPAVTFLATFF